MMMKFSKSQKSRKYNPVLSRIRAKLLKRNQNCLMIIAGDTGSGKSYAAMRIAQMIDPNFSISNVVFTPKEFMKLIEKNWISTGSCIIFDEAGVGMPSREWYTIQNKMLGYVMQTFRHMNLCVIFTVPNMSFIDVQLRNLFHIYLETQSINYKKKKCKLRVFYFRQWPRSSKILSFHPRFKEKSKMVGSGLSVRYTMWNVGMPTGFVIADYEEKKGKFSRTLRSDALKYIDRVKGKTKTEKCIKMLEEGKYKQVEVARKLKMSPQQVCKINSVNL